jgi:hypothetical protein
VVVSAYISTLFVKRMNQSRALCGRKHEVSLLNLPATLRRIVIGCERPRGNVADDSGSPMCWLSLLFRAACRTSVECAQRPVSSRPVVSAAVSATITEFAKPLPLQYENEAGAGGCN